MRITKLTSMTLIKYKNNTPIFQVSHFFLILQLTDGSIEFLYGGNYELAVFSFSFFIQIGTDKLWVTDYFRGVGTLCE